eukprot:scaffold959_cov119-Isochrysis_galbana.AAC.6
MKYVSVYVAMPTCGRVQGGPDIARSGAECGCASDATVGKPPPVNPGEWRVSSLIAVSPLCLRA